MKIKVQKYAAAAALTVAVIYTIWAAFMLLAPEHTAHFLASLHLMPSSPFNYHVTFLGYLRGVFFHALFAYLIVIIGEKVYHRLPR